MVWLMEDTKKDTNPPPIEILNEMQLMPLSLLLIVAALCLS